MNKNRKLVVLILAAGFGTRMKSDLPKVLHCIGGLPLILHVIKSVSFLKPDKIVVVVGQKAKLVEESVKIHLKDLKIPSDVTLGAGPAYAKVSAGAKALSDKSAGISVKIEFVQQKLLKGSGRAVQEALGSIRNYNEIMILCGDAPLFRDSTLKEFLSFFRRQKTDGAVLTADLDNPSGYGRIKKSAHGIIERIVEDSDASCEELRIKEVNSGAYIFKTRTLTDAVRNLSQKGPKKEYYLTDAIENSVKNHRKILSFKIKDSSEIIGINSRKELAMARKIMNKRINDKLMSNGVTLIDPDNTYIDETVRIGKDTLIYPGVHITGKTIIGKNCSIGPVGVIDNCKIDDNVEIKFACCLYSSRIRKNSVIGPFSHIRPESDIGPNAKVGNFSEVKKSRIMKESKVPHLSYIGDAEIGTGVNVGAGTITCNYDGIKKYKTVIKNNAFIGSNTNLIAPVSIGSHSLIGAGSTITKNVPNRTLAIARAQQVMKPLKNR